MALSSGHQHRARGRRPVSRRPSGHIHKVNAGRVSNLIVEQIRLLIRGGQLKAGDRLPSERELGERFGVSRVTVREALKMLEANGLVTIKVGARGGAFVTAPTSERVGEGISDLLTFSVVEPSDVTEARQAPADAVLRAASIDTLARMTLAVASAGGTPQPIPQADLAELPDLGSAFTLRTAWRHELARISREAG